MKVYKGQFVNGVKFVLCAESHDIAESLVRTWWRWTDGELISLERLEKEE